MKSWEKQLMQHILNERYLGENEEQPKMRTDEKKSFLEAVANYHRLGEMIYAKRGLKEVTKTVQNIVEKAEALTIQESEHWFDNVTVSRHMKQLKEAYKVFEKTSGEMSGLQQRLEAAYDDMGSILGRYYKVGNSLNEDDYQYTAGVDDEGPALEEDAYTAGIDDEGPALKESYFPVHGADSPDVKKAKAALANWFMNISRHPATPAGSRAGTLSKRTLDILNDLIEDYALAYAEDELAAAEKIMSRKL